MHSTTAPSVGSRDINQQSHLVALQAQEREIQKRISLNFAATSVLIAEAQALRIEIRMIREEFYARSKLTPSL